jgi:serine/threonine protein kinase
VKIIGSGAQAKVYEAFDHLKKAWVAVKLMKNPSQASMNSSATEREALTRLQVVDTKNKWYGLFTRSKFYSPEKV